MVTSMLLLNAGIVLLVSGMTLRGVTATTLDTHQASHVQASALANACAQRALQQLQQELTYTGGDIHVIGQHTCSIGTVAGTGADDRVIQTWSTVHDTISRFEVEVTTLVPSVRIASWREVNEF